jgi:hypothetical protein
MNPAFDTSLARRMGGRGAFHYLLVGVVAAGAFAAGMIFQQGRLVEKPPTPVKRVAAKAPATRPVAQTGKGWNPHDALGEIFAKTIGGQRLLALAQLVQDTPVENLAGLIEEAMHAPYAEKDDFLKLAYAKWLAADPAAAFTHAKDLALRANTYEPMPKVLAVWAMADPKAALAAAQTLANANFRRNALRDVLTAWAQADPASAIATARTMPKALRDAVLPAMFDQWSRIDPQAAFAALDQIADAGVRAKAASLVVHNFAFSDPAGALALARSLPVSLQNKQLFADIFTQWGQQDPAAALAAAQLLPGGASRTQALESMFASWAALDPLSALKAAEILPKGPDRDGALAKSFASLAADDPASAASYLANLPAGPARNQLVATLADAWADSDPAAALAWLDKNAVGSTFDDAIKGVLTKLSQVDPLAAINFIGGMPDNASKTSFLQTVVGEWAKADPATAAAWVDTNLSGNFHDAAMASALNSLIAADPKAAIPYMLTIQNINLLDGLAGNLGAALAGQDTQAALDWLNSLPADKYVGMLHLEATQAVFGVWIDTDPADAAAHLPDPVSGDLILGGIVRQLAATWGTYDGPAATAWASSLKDESGRLDALQTSLSYWGQSDPAAAWDYVADHPEVRQGLMANEPFSGALETWVQTDPMAAVAAIAALPDDAPGNLKLSATREFVSDWTKADPQAASQWINSLPQGTQRDNAVQLLVLEQAPANPAAAFNWALSMTTVSLQRTSLGTAIRNWAKVDQQAATSAVQSANLSDDTKATLLNTIDTAVNPLGPRRGGP